jgi:RND superfamily putative drug exporter
MIGAGYFGVHVTKSLSAAGFRDPHTESSQVADMLSQKFGQGDLQMVFTVRSDDGAQSAAARNVGIDVVSALKASPYVASVSSTWTVPPAAAAVLTSRDGKTGLVTAGITGGGSEAQRRANQLADQLGGERNGVTVTPGGPAVTYAEINKQAEHDLLVMESIAIPFSFVVLVWVFGGLLAAAVPLAVGIWAIIGSTAVLRLLTLVTDVSTFALNLTVAMGLAMAVDYTLLILTRFRDERADGAELEQALLRTVSTAGRTVLFSALTVGLSMLALALFPMYFLKSFALAGITVVALTALAALVIAPAAIVLLGDRIDALDLRRLGRRLLRRPPARPKPCEETFFYRTSTFAIRHAVPVCLAVVAFLLLLGAPFLHMRWGFPDERMLPASAPSRQIGDQLRNDFPNNAANSVIVLIPDVAATTPAQTARFAADLSAIMDVTSVSAPDGTYVNGLRVGPPSAPTAVSGGSAFLTVNSSAPEVAAAHPDQLDWLHAQGGPNGAKVIFGGNAQISADNAHAINSRLPWVLALMAVITFALLFLLTGSVVLPVKAVILNLLSLTATFGALVWIFQDGHLGGLGTTVTGTMVAQVPVLLFCVAFGLSMDYEVFLIARIREYWLTTAQQSVADNDRSIALGLARTGRVVTAAALLMAISFSALMASQVSIMRMFGLGLTLAVLVDASLVRMLLVPAFMHALGRANWWAPRRLARWHARFGLRESGSGAVVRRPEPQSGRHRLPKDLTRRAQ